jgi:hypothetical protein
LLELPLNAFFDFWSESARQNSAFWVWAVIKCPHQLKLLVVN